MRERAIDVIRKARGTIAMALRSSTAFGSGNRPVLPGFLVPEPGCQHDPRQAARRDRGTRAPNCRVETRGLACKPSRRPAGRPSIRAPTPLPLCPPCHRHPRASAGSVPATASTDPHRAAPGHVRLVGGSSWPRRRSLQTLRRSRRSTAICAIGPQRRMTVSRDGPTFARPGKSCGASRRRTGLSGEVVARLSTNYKELARLERSQSAQKFTKLQNAGTASGLLALAEERLARAEETTAPHLRHARRNAAVAIPIGIILPARPEDVFPVANRRPIFSAQVRSDTPSATCHACSPGWSLHKLTRHDGEAQFIDSTSTTPFASLPR
jgi:hypothetical protein